MNEETNICFCCEEEYPEDELIEFEGHLYCEECLENSTVICTHCGERIRNEDNAGNDDMPLCIDCYNRHYTRCDDCGRVIHEGDAYYDEDDDVPYCCSCFDHHRRRNGIQSYYYKPVPIFYGEGPRYMGVELEIDGAGEDDESAEDVMKIANEDAERMYCKHDGSLDEGFEMVTHPMSLDYHLHQMPWKQVMAEARSMGYYSHNAGTCGLHVHVSRAAFGRTTEEQDACIARVLYFFEKHWEELLKFSRRTARQLDQWAARYGYKDQPKEVLENAKKAHMGRYTCVNLTNSETIEFRMWRGTLKYNTLIATLQMVDRICDVAIYLSDREIKELSWTTFVSGCQQPELVQYLKERRLYVNEPVQMEGEV